MPGERRFSHVLFDLDHTLSRYPIPTVGIVAATWERLTLPADFLGSLDEIASRYDALWVELERTARSADDLRYAVWLRILDERGAAADGLARRIAEEYGALRRAHGVQWVEGARELLADLRRVGYGLGLLTNGLSDVQWQKIRSLLLGPAFDAIAVAGDTGIYKPEPRAFLDLLDRLAGRASDALFVGDSYETDVLGAHAAGMAAAWIRSDGTEAPGPVKPSFSLRQITDLREVLL